MADVRTPARSSESGIALVYAIFIVAAVAGMTGVVMVNARASEEEARLTSDRVLTQPHVQSAITGYRMALGSRLASEADGFTLSVADMVRLAPSSATASEFVTQAAQLPAEYRAVAGVWQKSSATRIDPVPSYPMAAVAFHAPATADAATCSRLGLDPAGCASNLHGFWQVYRIELPDRTSLDSNGNVTVYFRAWLQSVDRSSRPTGDVSGATVVRAELRPGRFADYQLISDGQIQFGRGAVISGPVHSNGFELARDHLDETTVRAGSSIVVRDDVRCSTGGSLSTAEGAIDVASGGVGCATFPDSNRFISFLRVFDELDQLATDAAAGRTDVIVLPAVERPGVPGREHAWEAWLEGNRLRFRSPTGTVRTIPAGTGSTAILVEDDILLHGGDLEGRVTIAARRLDRGSANIYIDGNVNPNTTRPGRTLGLIAQGDIVIDMEGGTSGGSTPTIDCRVTIIRAAMIAAAGGLTIPTQYTTSTIQSRPPQCREPLLVDGSVAGHRSPNLQWQWAGWDDPVNYPGRWVGYWDREYRWDTRLLSSPPPYFPLTGTWQAVSVRVGNVDCYAGGRRFDARCR
ncbi:MAG: hypothetical protein JWM25_1104 [Thermoleophilia bacterium]|nr:hypothetical protein [Thermoleophilia bacterium]MCZ4496521.1 hypothetical protein [Thermoleophilia bacterium]